MSDYSTRIIRSTHDLPENQWNTVLSDSEYSTVYHKIGYLKAIEDGLDKRAAHVLAYKNDNLIGLLPNSIAPVGKGTPFDRLVSLQPGAGSFVLTGNELRVLKELCDAIHEFAGGKLVSQTIRADPPEHLLINHYLRDLGYRAVPGANFELNLNQGWENIKQGMSKDRRYDLRRAEDQSYKIKDKKLTQESLNSFYDRYMSKMDEINGQIKSKSFFKTLFEDLESNVKLFTAHIDGECRGFHFYLLDKFQSTMRHQYMAVMREDFEYYPGELLHKHAINWAISEGFDNYNFGGGKADLRGGTTKYKRQYGGELVPFMTWEKEFSSVYKLGRYIYRR